MAKDNRKKSNNNLDMIFMLGPGRCGNDFFRNILSASPYIFTIGPNINKFWTSINVPCGTVNDCRAMTASDFDSEISKKVKSHFYKEFNKRNSPYNLIYRTYRKIKYGNSAVIKNSNSGFILNKSAHMWNKILFLNRFFSESKFIWTIREPYSHINSIYHHQKRVSVNSNYSVTLPEGVNNCWRYKKEHKNIKNPNIDIKDVTKFWINSNWYALQSLDSIASNRVLVVNFEDLVLNPEKVLKEVELFLETEMNYSIDTSLVNNITKNPLKDWKNILTSSEKREISSVLETNEDKVKYILDYVQK